MDDVSPSGLEDVSESKLRDAEDVARTLAGDTTAYDRLIERYQRRAVGVSYRLLGNIEDAMDVCQEAFLRAYRSLATLQEPKWFGTWLLRIVSNLSLNYRRSRRPVLPLATSEDEPGVEIDSGGGRLRPHAAARPGDAMQSAEMERAISREIEALPEKQRVALVLFAVEGLPQKDVAEIMECSIEAVKWHVFQARKTLKDKLADYIEE